MWYKIKPEHHTQFNTLTPEWMAKRWIEWIGDGLATNLLIANIDTNSITRYSDFRVTDGIWYGDSTRGLGNNGSKPANGDHGNYTIRWTGVMAASAINCALPQLLTNSLVLVWRATDLYGQRNLVSMSSVGANNNSVRAMGRMYRSIQIGPTFYMGNNGIDRELRPIFTDPDKFDVSMTGANSGLAPVIDNHGNLSLMFFAEGKSVQRFDLGQFMDKQTAEAMHRIKQAVELIGPNTKPSGRTVGWAEKTWEIFDQQIRPYTEQVRRFTMHMDDDTEYVRKCQTLATLMNLTGSNYPVALSNWVDNWGRTK